MLEAFKIKPFDLEPIYAEWTDGPIFSGNPKKDPTVDEWLDQIKEGCMKRGVPEGCWYKVAQHFMGPKAKARLDELKAVITQVNGGKYRWTWKKFRIAMVSMGWDIDRSETKSIKFKASNFWFSKKKEDEPAVAEESNQEAPKRRRAPSRSGSFWSGSKKLTSDSSVAETSGCSTNTKPPVPKRSATEFWPSRNKDKEETLAQHPSTQKPHSESAVTLRSRSPSPNQSQAVEAIETSGVSNSGAEVEKVAQAPVWLLNACNALDFITSEHPKAMSVVSAILITVGSIPAIPAISAGAGGAVLASGAAHAIGVIAVGLGQALNMSVKNQQGNQQGNHQEQVHN